MMKTCAGRLGAVALACLSAACASTGAVPRPFPTAGSPPPRATPSTAATAPAPLPGPIDTYALVGTALDLRGVKYRNGGADPNGFDCSGFTQFVYGQHGLKLPRNVKDQFSTGQAVRPEELQEGDLLFFTTDAPGASHVGIAVGGDRFVHAPSSSGVVRVERLGAGYWGPRLVGIRRLL